MFKKVAFKSDSLKMFPVRNLRTTIKNRLGLVYSHWFHKVSGKIKTKPLERIQDVYSRKRYIENSRRTFLKLVY